MTILAWIEANLLRRPERRREQNRQHVLADLRKLKAEAEALQIQGRLLRREISAALELSR